MDLDGYMDGFGWIYGGIWMDNLEGYEWIIWMDMDG